MTTDDSVHLLGTKATHAIPSYGLMMLGLLLDSTVVVSFAAGMLAVLLFGGMRAQAENYRWRVEAEDTSHCQE